jgi:hypothetical protein
MPIQNVVCSLYKFVHPYKVVELFLKLPIELKEKNSPLKMSVKTTTSVELSPSSEAASWSAIQEFVKISGIPEFHYHVHQSHQMVTILNQINPILMFISL